ncbi:intersectin-1 [Adelges cooleyi]|uniref:intersectin-1 n=1 Tax=Adelges cooleyi TaxID=133065 RepID=UPI00217F7BF0|nr:intersectin-1 [Adelges cooleyi]XP_050430287.1 intersectin-1 [Adelges cooleyi]
MDPWVVTLQEWSRFCEHFQALKPIDGMVTGEQAKGFLLQSRLPPAVLGAIWALADTDADGRMNIVEFTIACKLISLKLRGLELPNVLPSNLWNSIQSFNTVSKVSSPLHSNPPSLASGVTPPMSLPLTTVSPTNIVPKISPPIPPSVASPATVIINSSVTQPVPDQPIKSTPVSTPTILNNVISQVTPLSKPATPAAPSLTGTPVNSMPMPLPIESPGNQEWAIPHQSKLKYTQLFNTTDRMRSGFLTGVQARGLMMATQLPQNVLAQIWNLSDMDKDGQLSCEEFVLAMYLCDLAKSGEKIHIPLPPELIPPSLRRQRQSSLTGPNEGTPESDSILINQTTFEDKRKENFEKGQAELERRRKALLEIQRKEQEERERKEREEQERKEKIRLEQEKRRQEELEIQMQRQRELEQEREEQRKRAQEQREAARKEMERQRQLEWEKQKCMELQQQRHKEQEAVLKLKAKNQSLTIDIQQMTEKAKELSQKISETRASVTGVKSTIDSMRSTRDTQMNEMSRLKSTLKEQNQRLISVSQEKIRLETKNKINSGVETAESQEQAQLTITNKQLALKNLQDKIGDLNSKIELKKQDVENNNDTLDQLKAQLTKLIEDCEQIYPNYIEHTQKVVAMKKTKAKDMSSWGDDAWNAAPTTEWPVDSSASNLESSAYKKCRALYEFEARNADELSFQPGDIIMVPLEQNAEPGWLAGELKNKTGWFPESYVETVDGTDDIRNIIANRQAPLEDNLVTTQKPLDEICELPENDFGENYETNFSYPPTKLVIGQGTAVKITAQVLSDWTGTDSSYVSLKAGDTIEVSENQGDWWYGKTSDNSSGWFNKNLVKVIENLVNDTNIPTHKQEYYTVIYPYESVEPGDLNLYQDEVVLVTKKDGDWWTGTIGDRSGVFPSNYVQLLEPQPQGPLVKNPPLETATSVKSETSVTSSPLTTPIQLESQKIGGSRSITPDLASTKKEGSAAEDSENDDKVTRGSKKAEVATVIAAYTATSAEQLSLQRGQLVKIRKKTTTGWWEGELQAKGQKRQIGWFPASYVKPLGNTGRAHSPAKKNSSSTVPVTAAIPSTNAKEKVIALFPFNAVHNDELSFQKDEIITIVSKDEQAWWRGEINGKTGLFPSNYVAPLSEVTIQVTLNKEERKRQQHILELINTEQAYIEDMISVHEVFEKPLYESKVLTTTEIRQIFINWEEIIECNQMFLTSLRVRRDMSPAGVIRIVGDILCEHFPRMTRYVRFCSCQLNAAITLQKLTETNPAFREVTKLCQSDCRTKGLPLSSFLIKPMQRITKYPLLVQKILENTPDSHPDRLHLNEALAKAEEICLQVNEGVREKENSDRLEWLQTHVNSEGLTEQLIFNSLTNSLGSRKFLHYGSLSKTKSGKELVGFLMNDMVLLVKPVKPTTLSGQSFTFDKFSGHTFKIYKQPFLLSKLNIIESMNDCAEFRLEYDNTPILLTVQTSSERNLWMKKLNEAKRILIASESNQKQLIESKKADFGACGRVLVFIMDGKKLQTPKKGKRAVFCEVSMGSRKQCTPTNESTDPKWDTSMQFLVKNIQDDILCITVFNKGYYSPDEFLGRSEIRVMDIIQATKNNKGPLTKHLQLREVQTGVITLKLDLCLFDKNN